MAIKEGSVMEGIFAMYCAAYLIDPNNGKSSSQVESFIDELRLNYTIIIVTHSMQQAARVSQKTCFFHLGELIETGDTKSHWEDLKMVVCPTIKALGEQWDYLGWSDDYVSDVVKNFESVNHCNIPFYWVGVRDYKSLWSMVGVEPNCGILAIMISLCYNVQY